MDLPTRVYHYDMREEGHAANSNPWLEINGIPTLNRYSRFSMTFPNLCIYRLRLDGGPVTYQQVTHCLSFEYNGNNSSSLVVNGTYPIEQINVAARNNQNGFRTMENLTEFIEGVICLGDLGTYILHHENEISFDRVNERPEAQAIGPNMLEPYAVTIQQSPRDGPYFLILTPDLAYHLFYTMQPSMLLRGVRQGRTLPNRIQNHRAAHSVLPPFIDPNADANA